jgi:large subunit ribosomal protein L3
VRDASEHDMAAKGILGRKLGMTQIWDAQNRVVPVTVIEAGPCRVVQLKTPERDGYAAVQLAFGATKPSRLSKPELGHLAKSGAEPSRELAELKVEDLTGYEVGQVIAADVFDAGDRVDVTGISKGKGFTGVMQRHNFKGQGASHGNHKKHRAPGAIGACATPARVFKGVRMAGQHGAQKVTTLNLEVVEGDPERGLLLVKGSVPGANGSLVFVRNAVKGPEVGPYEPRAKAAPEAEAQPETDEPAADVAEVEADETPAPEAVAETTTDESSETGAVEEEPTAEEQDQA